MKKKFLSIISLLSISSIVLLANGEELYQTCSGCHGDLGKTNALQQSAKIGGQEENLTIKELTAYKYGELNQYGLGNIMKLQLSNISEDEIKELAQYIESLDKNVSN